MIEIREAEIVDCNGYKLPNRLVDGFHPVSYHRTEGGAQKAADKANRQGEHAFEAGRVFILHWLSETGGHCYSVQVKGEWSARAGALVTK